MRRVCDDLAINNSLAPYPDQRSFLVNRGREGEKAEEIIKDVTVSA